MKIQKLAPSRRKEGRWLVWLEDGTLFRVGEGDVMSLALYAGKELDEPAVAALAHAAERGGMRERALGLLTSRPLSKKELVDRLSAPPQKRNTPEVDPEERQRERERLRRQAEETADRLEELGLLDDRAYAGMVVRHYAGKGYGERKLRDELYRRGVPREYWEEALSSLEDRDGDSALDELLRKKLRGEEPTRENLKRASDWLARRGFGWSEISEAIERYRDRWGGSD